MEERSTLAPKRVGFVGLGNMGRPMATNLARAGFHLVVRDSDPARAKEFATDLDCIVAELPQAFADVDFLVTMLPEGHVVREVMVEWMGGIGSALPKGSVVIDMSSSVPAGTRALAGLLAENGVAMVDAAVSGGIGGAEDGTLALMIGGEQEDVRRAHEVLECLGTRLFHLGPVGAGHAMKALNNFVGATSFTAACEALAIGRTLGLDPAVMVDVLNASTGRSFSTENSIKAQVLTGEYGSGFRLPLLAKDVRIAADLSRETSIEAPVCAAVDARWAEALAALGQSAMHSEAHRQWWPVDLSTKSTPAD
jgi:3-hydroxyisobutyrate dehydrogenase